MQINCETIIFEMKRMVDNLYRIAKIPTEAYLKVSKVHIKTW